MEGLTYHCYLTFSLAKEIFACNLLKGLFVPELLPSVSYPSSDAKTHSSQAGAPVGPLRINNSPLCLPDTLYM